MKHRTKTAAVTAVAGRRKTRPAAVSLPARAQAWETALVVLQRETPMAPAAVAHGVCEEVGVYLAAPVPANWAELLVEKTALVSTHNPRFRRLLRQPGDRGRDRLWAFMRHWLAALLKQQRPACFARLPEDYCRGRDLPVRC